MKDSYDGAWSQLATRIPRSLHRALKLHVIHADTSIMDFVVEALEEKLGREQGKAKRQA